MATGGAGAADDAVATDFFFYVSQQNPSGDFDQKLTGFVANLEATCVLPNFKAEFVTFKHHIIGLAPTAAAAALVDSPAWRGLLRLSLHTAKTPDAKELEDFGNLGNDRVTHGKFDIVLYPPYQFATQVLLGGSLNLRHPETGLAFAETVKSHVLPINFNVSFEEFMRVASGHVRNVFAHATEPYFLGQNSLYRASKKWCFSGTPLLTEPASPFWENRDILSYIFTATPYAFWIPLCYQRACIIMKQRKSGVFFSAVLQVTVDGFIQLADNLPLAVRQDDYVVVFDVDFGLTLKAGVSYHVMKSSDSCPTPSFRVSRTRSAAHPIEVAVTSFDPHSATPIATFQKCANILKDAAILECMPASQMAAEMPSLLDSYFDYDLSLAELMSQLGDGCNDAELFEDPNTSQKKHLHENTDFRSRFASLREKFNNRISLLSEFYKLQCRGDVDPHPDVAIWCKSYHIVSDTLDEMFFVDLSISSSNWLGLSKVEAVVNFVAGKRHCLHVRIPKAVKTQPCPPDRLPEFEKIMATLKTGSHVASATKQTCWEFAVDPLVPDDTSPPASQASPKSHRTPRAQEFYEQRAKDYWLSEAGICTLEELFRDGVVVAERETLAFRDLMRHMFQSMALGVLHLHECGISHNGISAKYFKIFPIYESSVQRLRVKLVSLKAAAIGGIPDSGFDCDIRQLGHTMLSIATNPDNRDLESLKTYDPSLYFLIKWMTSHSLPTMHEVLRHPYFMSTTERKAFGLALGGGMIGAYLADDADASDSAKREQAVVDAVASELKNHLDNQLRCMLDATKTHVASAVGAPHDVVAPGPPPPAPPAADGAKKYCDGIYLLLVAQKARGFHFMDFRVCVELARDQRPAIESPYFGTPFNNTRGYRAIDIIRADKRFQIDPNFTTPRISLAPA